MRITRVISFSGAMALAMGMAASAAPPVGKGGGKDKGGGGDDGSGDPPAETFVPEIAYFEEDRKGKDLKLANRAGDAACVVLQSSSGSPKLRGFEFHAPSKLLAYSIDDTGIFLASWSDDPCFVGGEIQIRAQVAPESLDFSPDGKFLVWRENVDDWTGLGTAAKIFIFDVTSPNSEPTEVSLEAWGGERPEWGVNGEWGISSQVRFSPDFATSNELIFAGASLDGRFGEYDSLFAYNIDETTIPRKLLDGANVLFDWVLSVTNPSGQGAAKVAFTNNNTGEIIQIPINGGLATTFSAYGEPEYSCDNFEIIHRSGSGRKLNIEITGVDGTPIETWSKADLRFFDWFCP